jgi:hypothetical protein
LGNATSAGESRNFGTRIAKDWIVRIVAGTEARLGGDGSKEGELKPLAYFAVYMFTVTRIAKDNK